MMKHYKYLRALSIVAAAALLPMGSAHAELSAEELANSGSSALHFNLTINGHSAAR